MINRLVSSGCINNHECANTVCGGFDGCKSRALSSSAPHSNNKITLYGVFVSTLIPNDFYILFLWYSRYSIGSAETFYKVYRYVSWRSGDCIYRIPAEVAGGNVQKCLRPTLNTLYRNKDRDFIN